MHAPRYDWPMRLWWPPDAATLSSNEAIFKAQQDWCAKNNDGAHRKLRGTSTCLDCGQDLDS